MSPVSRREVREVVLATLSLSLDNVLVERVAPFEVLPLHRADLRAQSIQRLLRLLQTPLCLNGLRL